MDALLRVSPWPGTHRRGHDLTGAVTWCERPQRIKKTEHPSIFIDSIRLTDENFSCWQQRPPRVVLPQEDACLKKEIRSEASCAPVGALRQPVVPGNVDTMSFGPVLHLLQHGLQLLLGDCTIPRLKDASPVSAETSACCFGVMDGSARLVGEGRAMSTYAFWPSTTACSWHIWREPCLSRPGWHRHPLSPPRAPARCPL